ncbi:MAG: ABC transporter permease [Acidimicrobiaceae bacterium]|nr:ABC transporter permease [Acidimicrobiaceae bacterium]
MPVYAREAVIFVIALAVAVTRRRMRSNKKAANPLEGAHKDHLVDTPEQAFSAQSTPAALLVARREISQRLASRAYRVIIILMVLISVGAIAVPKIISSSGSKLTVATTPAGAKELRAVTQRVEKLTGVNLQVSVDASTAIVEQSIRSGKAAIGYADSNLIVKRPFAPNSTSSTKRVVSALSQGIQVDKILSSGAIRKLPSSVVAQILSPKPIKLVYLLPSLAKPKDLSLAIVGVVATFMLLSTYSAWVLMGVIEEKSSRVIEVLLSSISARSLLLGKMVGIGTAALAQAVTAVLAAILTTLAVGSSLLRGAGLEFILLQLMWLLLGYSFYCTVGALAGSLVSKVEDAQSVTAFIQIPLLLSYLASFAVISGNQNYLLKLLAYIPIFSPFLVPIYWSSGQMGLGQVFLAVAVNVLCLYLTYRLASMVYEATVFSRGKRLKFRAAIKLAKLAT